MSISYSVPDNIDTAREIAGEKIAFGSGDFQIKYKRLTIEMFY